jgi:hypothetical protein
VTDDIGQVYPLFPVVEGEYPTKEDKQSGYCRHHRTQFNTTSRRVHCIECGTEVDAFTVLQQLARDRERLDAHRDHVVRVTRLAEARFTEIKRQERNAKARMRRGQIELDEGAIRTVERETSLSLRAAPRVSGGVDGLLTIVPPDSKGAA